ncbi:hypothetical protein J1N35_026633 [Gossypium stocksii]|uniref:Reverse transcriptase zinc-binding domain-containing protein n=1 Tax=Gossypium stocksii TaxID=47602 RepID=A0A9D3V972_9ROSI|nr:hypothetical protein J1N35_026633 [Gossypium stocksii]
MKKDMRKLENDINSIIDSPNCGDNVKRLSESRCKLDYLHTREKRYWAQRLRAQWLKEGDRNTKYFHAKATSRLKKNIIEKIKNENRNWVTNSKDVCNTVKKYFWNLFQSNVNDITQLDLNFISKCIFREKNEWLTREYNENEVSQAIKQMDPMKAPEIDGLSGNFYKQYWDIMDKDTMRFCLDVLNGKGNISSFNETIIILIPKIKYPYDFTNFRPISLCSWTKKLLSYGGKEILIKAVLQSIPTYALSIFLASKGVTKDIQTKLSRTWWSGKEKGKFWSTLHWRSLCQPKRIGGINIRNMNLFYISLLGHQVWILINNKETLCFKVLSSRYFPDGNIFKPKRVKRASYTWSSIVVVVENLKDGFGWQVGDRESINITEDNWGQKDCMVWFHNPHGYYSSKTTYTWLLLKEMGYGPHRFFWKIIWKLNVLPKIRVFSWRVSHEILPTREKIASISSKFNQKCPRCDANTKTLLHALRDSTTSHEVLSMGGWDMSRIMKKHESCIDWIEDMMRTLDKKVLEDLFIMLWNYWNSRNNFIFKGQRDKAQTIWKGPAT